LVNKCETVILIISLLPLTRRQEVGAVRDLVVEGPAAVVNGLGNGGVHLLDVLVNDDLGLLVDLGLPEALISDPLELLILQCQVLLRVESLAPAGLGLLALFLVGTDRLLLREDIQADHLQVVLVGDGFLCP
jgi:hypothetical protein